MNALERIKESLTPGAKRPYCSDMRKVVEAYEKLREGLTIYTDRYRWFNTFYNCYGGASAEKDLADAKEILEDEQDPK